MVRDPAADEGRRVWATCPACLMADPDGAFMLSYEVGMIWCQCTRAQCHYRFYWNSGVGKLRWDAA